MKKLPRIKIQLVHIQGPSKGKIEEFSETKITVGRHPSSQILFPADLSIISRRHAEILREGNRFKLIDRRINGTFVNGKKIEEIYIKNGDVLTFAEGGPKVSFLTQIEEGFIEGPPPSNDFRQQSTPEITLKKKAKGEEELGQKAPQSPNVPLKPFSPRPEFTQEEMAPFKKPEIKSGPGVMQKVKVPLTIQYGPTLRSFKEVPVTIGKGPNCGFILDLPTIDNQHAQIFYSQDQYWVKDLTGQKLVTINQKVIDIQSPLHPTEELSLSPEGPRFRFFSGGRLAEIETPIENQKNVSSQKENNQKDKQKNQNKSSKGPLSLLKKFLNS